MAEGYWSEVFIIESVVDFSKEREQLVARSWTTTTYAPSCQWRPHIFRCFYREVIPFDSKIKVVLWVHLHPCKGFKTTLAEFKIVSSSISPVPFCPVGLLELRESFFFAFFHKSWNIRTVEHAFIEVAIVYTKVRTHIQSFDRLDIHKSISKHTPIVVAIILIIGYKACRVLTVGQSVYRSAPVFAIGSAYWNERYRYHCRFGDLVRLFYLTGTVYSEIFTYGYHIAKELVISIDTSWKTREISILYHTIVVVIAQREEVIPFFSTISNWKVVRFGYPHTGDFFEPIGIRR